MVKTLIVPGLNGSPAPHWQDWWLSVDHDAVLVRQDDWSAPNLTEWTLRLAITLYNHPGAWIVGHSLGAILAVQVAARWPQLEIGGALLVAPADISGAPHATPALRAFADIPGTPLRFPATVVGSRNDPWITLDRARDLAGIWGAAFVDLGEAGHVNAESGFGPWPFGRALLETMRQAAAPAPLRVGAFR